jgi:hypothetical protein
MTSSQNAVIGLLGTPRKSQADNQSRLEYIMPEPRKAVNVARALDRIPRASEAWHAHRAISFEGMLDIGSSGRGGTGLGNGRRFVRTGAGKPLGGCEERGEKGGGGMR